MDLSKIRIIGGEKRQSSGDDDDDDDCGCKKRDPSFFKKKQKMNHKDDDGDDGDEDSILPNDIYHHDESDEDEDDDVEVEYESEDDPDEESEDDPNEHTGERVVQTILSLGCFERIPIIVHNGGGAVPAEEVENMEMYQPESWKRMDRSEQKKVGLRAPKAPSYYFAFAMEDGMQSNIVVRKFKGFAKMMRKSIKEGGIGGEGGALGKVVRKSGGGKWRHGAFWVKRVSRIEYDAAVVDTAKFEEICVKFEVKQHFYIAFDVKDGKQSNVVVGKYETVKKMHKPLKEGGVAGD